jgi:hypothetical protein
MKEKQKQYVEVKFCSKNKCSILEVIEEGNKFILVLFYNSYCV